MIRKWMAMLVAVLMTVVMPLSALAATQHTITVVPGDALRSMSALSDLMDVMDVRITVGENSGAITALLQDEELITVGLTADAEYLYAQTELLGADVYCISWDDLFDKYLQAMEKSLIEAGVEDEALLQELHSSTDEMRAVISAAFAAEAAEAVAPAPEAFVQEMFPNDPEMAAYAESILERLTVEEGEFTFDKRDTADRKYRLAMDEADLLPLFDTAYMRDTLKQSLSSQALAATDAQLDAAVEEAITEVKKAFEEIEFEMIMEFYTKDADETPVGLDMIMNMFPANGAAEEFVQMAAVYDRLTGDAGVSHNAEMAVAAEGEVVKFAVEVEQGSEGKTEGMLGALINGEEYVITFCAEEEGEKSTLGVELYLRSGATAILTPAASHRPLVSVKVVSEPASAEVLSALENVSPETAVNVTTMTEVELNALKSNVSANGMQLFFTLLSKLPTSVLQLLMQSM